MNSSDETIYLSARGREPADREAYLDEACGDDTELRGRIEAMLADADAADDFFGSEAPTVRSEPAPVEGAAVPPSEREGDRIGRYRLLQQIGEGGFGVVWMAEQTEPVTRRVALKVIKLGMDTREVTARFEAERQALAMMDHENIAKVFDAGATETGRPYFVMELVRGVRVTEFCDARRLGVRERLELFVDICRAIGHAHQKGIIHRDLKPSNILVTMHGDRGVPKIIDFGIAKATQQKLTDKTLFTRFEQFVGTPVYMSPEQTAISGLDIDTRSDIYSLGILLYELLAGKPPFDADSLVSAGYEEMRRIIREEDPPKPSTRLGTMEELERIRVAGVHHTDPERLRRLVRGDLDWIVMKAIEKDRARRYETANALVEDIRRHLSSEPVSAGPPGVGYRMRKFARRNRIALGAAAVVVAALIVGTAVSVWQAVSAKRANERLAEQVLETGREKARAEENFRLARQAVDDYLRRVANDPRLRRGMLPLRNQLLTDALAYYEKLLESGNADRGLEETSIHAAMQVAEIHDLRGDKELALTTYGKALAMIGRSEDAGALRAESAACHSRMGGVYLGLDRYPEAEAALERAVAARTGLLREDPESEEQIGELAAAYNLLGVVRSKSYRAAEALGPLNAAADLVRGLVGSDGGSAAYESRLGSIYNNLADARQLLDDREESERMLLAAVEHQEKALERDPDNSGFREFLANHLYNLGVAMAERNESGSGDVLERSRRERERLVLAEPSVAQWQLDFARTYLALGKLPAEAFADADRADPQGSYEKAVAILDRLVAQAPSWNDARSPLAEACHRLGLIHLSHGRKSQALERWRTAEEHSARLLTDDPINESSHRSNLARTRYHIGYLLQDSGDPAGAIGWLTRSRDDYEQLYADGSRETEPLAMLSRCYNSLGLVFAGEGRDDEAEAAYVKGIALCRKVRVLEPDVTGHLIQLGGMHCNRGHLQRKRGAVEEALGSYRQGGEALAMALAAEPENPTAGQYWYNTISGHLAVLDDAGRVQEALELCAAVHESVPSHYASTLLLRHAYYAARSGDHALSEETLGRLPADVEFDDAALINVAGIHAINAVSALASEPELAASYRERALAWLERCLARGALERSAIEQDKDFDGLRGMEGFRRLMERAE